MLDIGHKKLPEKVMKREERFEIPLVKGHFQGNKTVISNFYQIAEKLNRKPEHIIKFLTRELATPADLTKTALILGTKVPSSRINEKIEKYVKEFVLCHECKKPDTILIKEGDFIFLKCLACGAKRPVRKLK